MFVLIDRKAGHHLFTVLFELRLQLNAGAEGAAAAGIERTARRRIHRAGQLAGQLDALAAHIRIQSRRRRQQRLSVRMARIVEDRLFAALSTQRPRYITITSSAMCSTTDRSCEMNT